MKIKNLLKKRFYFNNSFYVKNKTIYYPIFWKNGKEFFTNISYNAYQNKFWWIKKKFNNIKYNKLINLIRNKIIKLKIKNNDIFNKNKTSRLFIIFNMLYIYNLFFYSIYIDIFNFIKFINKKKKQLLFFLILSFKKNKLYINLQNSQKKNFLSISSGLFIKFFEKKKSFKKNKTIKFLMAKYIRKIFLITKIKNTILILKRTPVFLMEIINLFNSPIAHKFINPIENKNIEESNNNFLWIKFLYFIFIENKNYSKNKMPQKGRIKRKILRKVTFENKIID